MKFTWSAENGMEKHVKLNEASKGASGTDSSPSKCMWCCDPRECKGHVPYGAQ